jgi:hypothetical protein
MIADRPVWCIIWAALRLQLAGLPSRSGNLLPDTCQAFDAERPSNNTQKYPSCCMQPLREVTSHDHDICTTVKTSSCSSRPFMNVNEAAMAD